MFNWIFRNRQTGSITIVQSPNLALATFFGATIMRWIIRPSGTAATALDVVATGALVLWAIDELVRGVNPWRRALGAGTLAWQAVGLFSH